MRSMTPPARPGFRSAIMRGTRLFVVLGILAASLALAFLGVRHVFPEFITQRLRQEVSSAETAQASTLLSQAGQLGDAGIEMLLEALDSPRMEIAQASRRVLLDLAYGKGTSRRVDSQQQLHDLARLIAERTDLLGPYGRKVVRELGQIVLARARHEDPSQVSELAQDWDPLIQWSGELSRSPWGTGADRDKLALTYSRMDEGAASFPWRIRRRQPWIEAREFADASMLDIPGGGLEWELFDPPQEDVVTSSSGDSDGTRSLNVKPSPIAAGPGRGLDLLDSQADQPRGELDEALPGFANIRPSNSRSSRIAELSDLEVMRLLHSGPGHHRRAKTELYRRGFRDLDIEVASQVTHPETHVRQQMVEWLPRIAGIEPKPWLFLLSQDEHPRVRLAALGLMATNADPEFERRIIELSRRDTDPEVRDRAEGILAGRLVAAP